MLTHYELKPNLPTRSEKAFLKQLKKDIEKPLRFPLPKRGKLHCKLGVSGSLKTLTIFKENKVFAVLRSFQPCCNILKN